MGATTPPVHHLRPAQVAILRYTGGPMAISAVPGAGKTFILEHLASRLITELGARPSEILILTYMRSAALNIKTRIAKTLADRGRTAYGLQASTLHSFAMQVVRRARGDEGELELDVMTETEERVVLNQALEAWLGVPANREHWEARSAGARAQDDPVYTTIRVALKAIGEAKHARLTPEDVNQRLGQVMPEIPPMYRAYLAKQRELHAVSYDDLISEAVERLESDAELRGYYQRRIRYVMEDEAQDSTPDQQAMLDLLTNPAKGGSGNLIRVGDSNQAIMTSFTHNDPRYFRAFCAEQEAAKRHFPMPESGRSALPIISVANRLVDFVRDKHMDEAVRQAFTGQPIQPVTTGPPNPPPGSPPTWTFYAASKGEKFVDAAAREEIGVLNAVRTYLRANPLCKAAVLVPSNKIRKAYMDRAVALGVELQSGAAGVISDTDCLDLLGRVLAFLAVPVQRQTETFLDVVATWRKRLAVLSPATGGWHNWAGLAAFLGQHGVEEVLYPVSGLPPRRAENLDADDYAAALQVGRALRDFLAVRHLPVSELLPTLAQGLLKNGHATAIAAKAALIVSRNPPIGIQTRDQFEWLRDALKWVADDAARTGNPLVRPPVDLTPMEAGRLSVMTMHSAKGLEFDAVWLPRLGYYNFRENKGFFPWEPANVDLWDRAGFEVGRLLRDGEQSPEARGAAERAWSQLAVAEKLRLLYVGITRAERELHLSTCGFDEAKALPLHVAMLAAACVRLEA